MENRGRVLLAVSVILGGVMWLSFAWALTAYGDSLPPPVGRTDGSDAGSLAAEPFNWEGTRPINLSLSQNRGITGGVQFPRLAVAPNVKRVCAVWGGLYGGFGDPVKTETLLSASMPRWQAWSTPTVVSPSLGSYSTHADIDIDEDGAVHLTWYERVSSSEYQLWYRKLSSSGQTVFFKQLAQYTNKLPVAAIAVSDAGDVHVAWTAGGDVFYRWSDDGGETWSDLARVVDLPSTSNNVAMALGGPNQVHLVWQEGATLASVIQYRELEVGGSVTAGSVITPSGQLRSCIKPDVVEADGDVLVSWGKTIVPQRFDLYLSRCSGSTCSSPAKLGHSVVVNSADPAEAAPVLAVDPINGTVAAVWHGDRESTMPGPTTFEEILFTRSSDGGRNWDPVSNVSRTTYERSIDPYVALEDGAIHIVWRERYESGGSQKYDTWYIDSMKYVDLPVVLRGY